MLWSRLKRDDFETDLIEILREMNKEMWERLAGLTSDDFSEIYLFFDYDGHNDNIPKEYFGKDILGEMLEIFDNETEFGKLYISYPMVEALKEISASKSTYATLYLELSEIGSYKSLVGQEQQYRDYRRLTWDMWLSACDASRKRACLIVQGREQCNYAEYIDMISQRIIYEAQKRKFIRMNKVIGILSSIPLFLLDYYDESFWNKVVCKDGI